MTYAVKETFYTLQGEGARTGRPAVFCRFARCNLWSGLERNRAEAVCRFCDTDFVGTDGPGGGVFHGAPALAAHVASMWPTGAGGSPYVVCTGGEPLLQLDPPLLDALHDEGFEVGDEFVGPAAHLRDHAIADVVQVEPGEDPGAAVLEQEAQDPRGACEPAGRIAHGLDSLGLTDSLAAAV